MKQFFAYESTPNFCSNDVLHLHAQLYWHADAKIVGTRKALEALRDAITHVLTVDGSAVVEAFVNDGEGYDLFVEMVPMDKGATLPVPYTDRESFPLQADSPA